LFSADGSIGLSGFHDHRPLVIGPSPHSLSAMITITGMDADAEPTDPERVLVVTAHPDDVDFGAAGTVARLTRAGCTVSYAIVTDGDAGELPEGTDRFAGGALRRREQLAAATEVGVQGDDVHFLGFTDGMLEATMELRVAITRVIRITRPEVVICQSPERRWDSVFASHPDHLAAAEATLRAVYPDARNPHTHTALAAEGLDAHTVRECWVMAHPDPDRYVDITDTFDSKVAALRAHSSQTAHIDLPEFIGGWVRGAAEQGGLPDGRLAEAFRTWRTG
jgi:LmbE family N-acetylglucosaminyl deacetylase